MTNDLIAVLACAGALAAGCTSSDEAAEDEVLIDSSADGPFAGERTVLRNGALRFHLPNASAGRYAIRISGTGNANLYVRVGAAPTTTTFDCRPRLPGSDESCEVTLTESSSIRIMVRGVARTSTFRLSVEAVRPSTKLVFTKQYRALRDDDAFLVGLSGTLAPETFLRTLRLEGPAGDTLLDVRANVGIWIDGLSEDPPNFLLFAVSPQPYPPGAYAVTLERTDGTDIRQTVEIAETVAQGRPRTLFPTSLGTTSPTPRFEFEPYVSPAATGDERRSLRVTVERNAGNRMEWEWNAPDPDATHVDLTDPQATGVRQLTPEEHIVMVGHLETRVVGDLDVGIENRYSTHFFAR